eukprot:4115061-Alexandrium_andersonii.AAC.1
MAGGPRSFVLSRAPSGRIWWPSWTSSSPRGGHPASWIGDKPTSRRRRGVPLKPTGCDPSPSRRWRCAPGTAFARPNLPPGSNRPSLGAWPVVSPGGALSKCSNPLSASSSRFTLRAAFRKVRTGLTVKSRSTWPLVGTTPALSTGLTRGSVARCGRSLVFL